MARLGVNIVQPHIQPSASTFSYCSPQKLNNLASASTLHPDLKRKFSHQSQMEKKIEDVKYCKT